MCMSRLAGYAVLVMLTCFHRSRFHSGPQVLLVAQLAGARRLQLQEPSEPVLRLLLRVPQRAPGAFLCCDNSFVY